MSPEQEAPLCVFCRKSPVEARWRPFCSERCKLQDLARWADGTYRVPTDPDLPDAEAGEDDTEHS
jgi:uncharacterized protein